MSVEREDGTIRRPSATGDAGGGPYPEPNVVDVSKASTSQLPGADQTPLLNPQLELGPSE